MRKREEIKNDLMWFLGIDENNKNSAEFNSNGIRKLELEVLLDIRDLLANQPQ